MIARVVELCEHHTWDTRGGLRLQNEDVHEDCRMSTGTVLFSVCVSWTFIVTGDGRFLGRYVDVELLSPES